MATADDTDTTPTRWDERARTQLAHALRSRVAGDDAAAKAAVIWGAEGERWFTPEDPIWRVHADAAMFPGGIRALLLQSLHPLAMAGVAGHSGFKGDPWGRLQRTSEFLATTTFGTIEHAEVLIERVRSIHERVRGKAEDGRPYAASDPHLLRWVHITEVDSFLTAFQRYASEPLTDTEADLYVEQTAVVARRLGVIDPPLTTAELAAMIEDYRPELQSTAASREAARFLLLHPPLPLAAKPGYAALAAGAVALLPRWARRPLRLPWLPFTEMLLARPLGDAATATVRWAMTDPADVRTVATESRAG
ncbi:MULTISPECIES: oxygenase MpaB family protein [unclassified Knoellia]|uniref:oxygenase MpaB family protein n=1 Tax=Knoellia altitudinis TaxID=3404795 RepID=UPI00360C5675